ncbi:response regulator [Flavobacterium sp.]|uniref:tetratricopeptide repeat-containing hybrid sensor histidine kinase/response regulator n=1 Tax=Flavobacterium sp. TaxID=239 RepID=UPI00286E9F8A|nr:response regulator [Flavobacterium sp.]
MSKHLILIVFFLTNYFVFGQNTRNNVTIIDSAFYYNENSKLHKDNKLFDKALENSNKAIIYAQKTKNISRLADGYFTLALVYIDLKEFDKAIENLIRSVSILNSIEPGSRLALTYYNLGLCYMQKLKFSKAESYFEKANSAYDSIDLPDAKNMVNLQKAILYIEKEEYLIAEKILAEISLLQKNKNIYETQSEALYQLGLLKSKAKINNLALNYLFRGYELSKESNNISQQIKITKKVSEVYGNMLQNNNSFKYLKINTQLRDSLDKIYKSKKINIASDKFKVDEMLRSMERMEIQKKQQEKSVKFSKLINILSIALITILSLSMLSLYKNNIIRNKSNELLKGKNNELEIAKERIEKASKARAEFLSTVSHELRTPLNAINGISHILLDDDPKPNQIEYLKSLKFSGNYLLTYINEILEINRIESNNIEVEKISFNLRELLHNIQNSLKEEASKNNNQLLLNIDEDVPNVVISDPTKISQISINLINNALKFTENGIITVSTKINHIYDDTCNIRFDVQDTGIGIPTEKLESIFDSFSQGSVEINRKYGGTGLGLTIVKRLVSLLGGKIAVSSEIGKGSTFTYNLEFQIGKALVESTINSIEDESIFVNKSILLVEDNKINQMITKKILEKKEMICELCETGEDAITKMQTNKYDLVLMDVHLPGINGTIATEEIRKFDKNTPIIALTAISLDENREMLLSYGMTDVITKPFNPDAFYKTLEQNFLIVNVALLNP